MNKSIFNAKRFILKPLLNTLALLVVLLLVVVIYGGFNILTHSQSDNQEHLRYKQAYLSQLESRAPLNDPPNIVFVLYDDMGYGDIGPGSSEQTSTPHIDRLAENGVTLTQFYSPAPSCTPSRTGFLTGRLAPRAGLSTVVFPSDHVMTYFAEAFRDTNWRLPAEETLIPEMLRAVGYSTAMIGKWHLGDTSPSLPNEFGFQQYFGPLYSNDMTPFALYRNTEIEMSAPADQTRLSETYTREATRFIRAKRDNPFFLYFAHSFPHIPLFTNEENAGRSRAGLYGDVIEEIDDGVGEIIQALEDTGQLDNTIVIVTSDNGPWFQGSPGERRGRKGDTFEGGMRVPFIAHWPNRLPAGTSSNQIAMGIDLLPTIASWLGLPLPQDRIIDGRSIASMLESGSSSPHEYLHYYSDETLLAVRDQHFKFRPRSGIAYGLAHTPVWVGFPRGPWLFDIEDDATESFDVSMLYVTDMERLSKEFDRKQEEMTTNKRGWLPIGGTTEER